MATNSLDTSLLIRFIMNDVPGTRQKVRDLLSTPSTTHHIFDLALTETVYVLENVYEQTREEIVNELNFFLTRYADVLAYNHALTTEVFPFYLTHPKLSFNDCCLAAYAELEKAEPLFTLDQKLARQHHSAKLLA